jgi:hypothetical protein
VNLYVDFNFIQMQLNSGPVFRRAVLRGWEELLIRAQELRRPFGREQSFKLVPGRLVADRLLVGLHAAGLDAQALFGLCEELGLPPAGRALLEAQLPRANAVFLACEEAGGPPLYKAYLEFWDEVRARVRAGDRSPQVLHFGVKWSAAQPGRHEEARYVCHPLLASREVLLRMAAAYPAQDEASALEPARAIVRMAARRRPDAAFLYLDASETGNPRRSFDINLYAAGLQVQEAAGSLRQAASHFGVPARALEDQLQVLGPLPLGHLSGGRDRRGAEFLSVYAEVAPLPAAP